MEDKKVVITEDKLKKAVVSTLECDALHKNIAEFEKKFNVSVNNPTTQIISTINSSFEISKDDKSIEAIKAILDTLTVKTKKKKMAGETEALNKLINLGVEYNFINKDDVTTKVWKRDEAGHIAEDANGNPLSVTATKNTDETIKLLKDKVKNRKISLRQNVTKYFTDADKTKFDNEIKTTSI